MRGQGGKDTEACRGAALQECGRDEAREGDEREQIRGAWRRHCGCVRSHDQGDATGAEHQAEPLEGTHAEPKERSHEGGDDKGLDGIDERGGPR
jgi:hypothetical protein